jgi:hypothetical protein
VVHANFVEDKATAVDTTVYEDEMGVTHIDYGDLTLEVVHSPEDEEYVVLDFGVHTLMLAPSGNYGPPVKHAVHLAAFRCPSAKATPASTITITPTLTRTVQLALNPIYKQTPVITAVPDISSAQADHDGLLRRFAGDDKAVVNSIISTTDKVIFFSDLSAVNSYLESLHPGSSYVTTLSSELPTSGPTAHPVTTALANAGGKRGNPIGSIWKSVTGDVALVWSAVTSDVNSAVSAASSAIYATPDIYCTTTFLITSNVSTMWAAPGFQPTSLPTATSPVSFYTTPVAASTPSPTSTIAFTFTISHPSPSVSTHWDQDLPTSTSAAPKTTIADAIGATVLFLVLASYLLWVDCL